MFAKKTLVTLSAGTLLAAAVPAFADHDSWRNRHRTEARHGYATHHSVVERRVVRERTVVVNRPVYREPAYGYGEPVYGYGYPAYSGPAYGYGQPVYHYERDNTAAMIGGAAIGALIGSQVGHGHNPGAIAAGAVIGGIIGSNF